MGYYIDFEKITIDDYKQKLESGYLPPSRTILKDRLIDRFGYFQSIGIKNVQELIQLLRKKERFNELSKLNIFPGDYLTILLRELNSLLPKPNKISDFNIISKEIADKLEKAGINNTVKLYNKVLKKSDRQMLSELTGIDEADILKLTKLADLSRIKWVGVTFARMLYDIGLDTVSVVANSDPADVHSRIRDLNNEKQIYKGQIGLNDMKILVYEAKQLPLDVEY